MAYFLNKNNDCRRNRCLNDTLSPITEKPFASLSAIWYLHFVDEKVQYGVVEFVTQRPFYCPDSIDARSVSLLIIRV